MLEEVACESSANEVLFECFMRVCPQTWACLQGERVTLVLGLPWYLSSGLEAISQVGPLPYHPGQRFTSSVEQMCFAMHDIIFFLTSKI